MSFVIKSIVNLPCQTNINAQTPIFIIHCKLYWLEVVVDVTKSTQTAIIQLLSWSIIKLIQVQTWDKLRESERVYVWEIERESERKREWKGERERERERVRLNFYIKQV